ncbi:MAG TPA: hypothetical protein VNP20_17210 [Nocardioidaceae bacterium]|nr:hypothetical protein [Nocardioidaceae bacterium]
MGRRHVISARVDQARKVVLLRGWQAKELAVDAGCKPLWSAAGKGWVIDLRRLPDVEAYAQHQRIVVNVVETA